jgi:hypothetical protein
LVWPSRIGRSMHAAVQLVQAAFIRIVPFLVQSLVTSPKPCCCPLQGGFPAATTTEVADPARAIMLARHNNDLAFEVLDESPVTDIAWPEASVSPPLRAPRRSSGGASESAAGKASDTISSIGLAPPSRRVQSPVRHSMFRDDGDELPAAKVAAKAILGAAATPQSGQDRSCGPTTAAIAGTQVRASAVVVGWSRWRAFALHRNLGRGEWRVARGEWQAAA